MICSRTKLATVFDVLYNVLHEKDQNKVVNPEDLVRLIDFSIKLANENAAILLKAEDIALEKL